MMREWKEISLNTWKRKKKLFNNFDYFQWSLHQYYLQCLNFRKILNSHHNDLTFLFFLDLNYLISNHSFSQNIHLMFQSIPTTLVISWSSITRIISIKMIARSSSCIAGARVRARNTWDRSYSRGAADSTTNIVAGVAETRYERCCSPLCQ